ncbi:Dienelactone hydrolase family protein [Lactiplantibacillus pentosus KCA1]|nr:alpha/beta hydrolase [Lactiplantibacillus pentosus]EIW14578.1 Dienelactone hydrolase family protein [Lactiplantibacillus pentosus KCA1]
MKLANHYNVQLTQKLNLTQEWDKTFPKSDAVDHTKVELVNRYGITLAADLYMPKNTTENMPAIAVASPYGAVKEQAGGLYAQTLAERGFVTIVFDPSFTGESGGNVRNVSSPDINIDDFSSAVDYLDALEVVDSERIGVLGVCGWGCYTFPLAAMDTRVKAVVSSTMGVFDQFENSADRIEARRGLNALRSEIVSGKKVDPMITVPDIDADSPEMLKDYYAYYRTQRGYHKRSVNSGLGWAPTTMLSHFIDDIYARADEVTQPVLLVHGDKAWSYQQSVDMLARLTNAKSKELITIKGATHCDLYDGGDHDYIPFDKIEAFFKQNL